MTFSLQRHLPLSTWNNRTNQYRYSNDARVANVSTNVNANTNANVNTNENSYASNIEFSSNGLPMTYWCQPPPPATAMVSSSTVSSSATSPTTTVDVSFAYELTFDSQDSDYSASLQLFEWSMLWNTVQEMGLDTCRNRFQNRFQARRLRFLQHDLDERRIVGLSSAHQDAINANQGSCSMSLAVSGTCIPMMGYMQVIYFSEGNDTADTTSISRLVRSHIQNAMKSPSIMVGTIYEVNYVPNSSDELSSSSSTTQHTTTTTSTSRGKISDTSWACFIAACVIVILVAMMLLIMTRQRRHKQEQHEEETNKTRNVKVSWGDADQECTDIEITTSDGVYQYPPGIYPNLPPATPRITRGKQLKSPPKAPSPLLDPIYEDDIMCGKYKEDEVLGKNNSTSRSQHEYGTNVTDITRQL